MKSKELVIIVVKAAKKKVLYIGLYILSTLSSMTDLIPQLGMENLIHKEIKRILSVYLQLCGLNIPCSTVDGLTVCSIEFGYDL